MTARRAFTLVELMIVVLIVAILAAAALPLMHGRIDASKWSEANAAAGSIRQAVRTYRAEKGPDYANYAADLIGGVGVFGPNIGVTGPDLDGRYFLRGCYAIDSFDVATGNCQITVNGAADPGPGRAPTSPATRTLTQSGDWN